MARHIYTFDAPDRFVAGTIGQPGNRTFFLQARRGTSVLSVVLEKTQVAALAERMGALLEEIATRTGQQVPLSLEPEDTAPLDEPLIEAFRVGTMSITWDGEERSIVIEARAVVEEDSEVVEDAEDDDPNGPDLVRVTLDLGHAQAFAERAARVVAAGRPPCPICGQPLNPEGHLCPRRNGFLH